MAESYLRVANGEHRDEPVLVEVVIRHSLGAGARSEGRGDLGPCSERVSPRLRLGVVAGKGVEVGEDDLG